MRSLFVRWSVAVIVGSFWGVVVPPARPRIIDRTGLKRGMWHASRHEGSQKTVTSVTPWGTKPMSL
jgi:hypothetical protein